MTMEEYDNRAEELANTPAGRYGSLHPVVGWINYSLNAREPEPRIVKMRLKTDIPIIKKLGLEDKYGEMVVQRLNGDIVSYSLIDNSSNKLDREFSRAVYHLDGTPITHHKFTMNFLQRDEDSLRAIYDYFGIQDENEDDVDDKVDESYSPARSLTDRFGRVVGYISVDSRSGDQMLQDRHGSIRGWYRKSSDITSDRYGRIIGFGNILTTLINK